jgi:hypothetical protein
MNEPYVNTTKGRKKSSNDRSRFTHCLLYYKDDAGSRGGGLLQVEYEKEHELLRKIRPTGLVPIFARGRVMSTKI